MSKKMNEYELEFNSAAGSAPQEEVAAWLAQNEDVARTQTMTEGGRRKLALVSTEEVARRVAEAFSGTVASIQMAKENVVTIPDAYKKKARRPGFES